MTFLADSIRLPKDPPKHVDANRITYKMIMKVACDPSYNEIQRDLDDIRRLAGIPDFERIKEFVRESDWSCLNWSKKLEVIFRWLNAYDPYRS